MAETPRVLIVGAGPVGLVTAIRLTRAGVSIRIVDAAAGPDKRMRASTLHPPTLDMLASLGLAEPLIDEGLKVERWQLRQLESKKFVNFDLATIADRTPHPFRLQIEQFRVCEMAMQVLAEAGVVVEFETPVESIEPDADGVEVRLGDDAGCYRADWVIGADGASSVVRRSLGVEFAGKDYVFCSLLVATRVPFHEEIGDLEDITYCWSSRGPFSLLRMRTLWRVCLYPEIDDFDTAANEEHVRDWLGYLHADAGRAEIADIVPYRAKERCADRFRVGRVCLAGDAAHLNPTSGGMGMNGGIHDAWNLTEKLIAVLDGESEDLMDLYARQRRFAASEMVIPRASANKARMAVGDPDAQIRRLTRYRAIAGDADRCREYVLAASMITGLEEANAVG